MSDNGRKIGVLHRVRKQVAKPCGGDWDPVERVEVVVCTMTRMLISVGMVFVCVHEGGDDDMFVMPLTGFLRPAHNLPACLM